MNTSIPQPHAPLRRPLTSFGTLTSMAMLGLALALVYAQALLNHAFQLELTIVAVMLLVVAAMNAAGRRWAPLLGALLSLLIVGGNSSSIIYTLAHPEAFHPFAHMVVAVSLALVGLVAGSGATVQNYRAHATPTALRTPRWVPSALTAIVALGVGAILVAAILQPTGPGVSPTALAGLPVLTTPGFTYNQTQVTAKVGAVVALRLANTHTVPHSFDLDALDVHVPVAAGESNLVLFTPTQPGTYTFYCGVPGHREAGMVGTLVVAP